MILKLKADVAIEGRGYPAGIIERLRALLEGGVRAELDPHRGDCYDLADDSRAYYIYVSPVSGRVVLLATCLKETAEIPRRPPVFTTPSFGSMSFVR